MYESACEYLKGKDAVVPGWIDVTSGGRDSESSGGIPTSLVARVDEYADVEEMLCDRSLHRISSRTSSDVRVFCEATDESKKSCK